MRLNLPNAITVLRFALAPLVALLLFRPSASLRLLGFVVFLVAAVSDLWDGYLARRRGETTDFGKVADPIADKLLLAAVLIPLYWLTAHREALAGLPVLDIVPLWAVLILLGREVLITGLRLAAARRGRVLAAARVGKHKALSQNIFLGAGILWLAFRTAVVERGWAGARWESWQVFHGWFVTSFLVAAVLLTLYSLFVYLVAFRRAWPTGDEGGGA